MGKIKKATKGLPRLVCTASKTPLLSKLTLTNGRYISTRIKGCTQRATEALRWLEMSPYQCINMVNSSVGTLLCCDRGYSSKCLLMENVFSFGFGLIQTCLIFPLQWACFPIKTSRKAKMSKNVNSKSMMTNIF